MTNPNDILDAYDELVRLVDILGPDTLRSLVDRACGRRTETPPKPLASVPDLAPDPAPPAHRAKEPTPATGCPWCGLDIGKNSMFRHLNNTHRADLEQLYVEDGTKGLQDVFGVPYGTAYGWACKLDGEVA